MSFLPETASFEELVSDCFLAFRGSGVMLSPLDAAVLVDWSRQKVPFEVVARGLKRAAERALWDARPGEPVLRTLRGCRKSVDTEIRKYLGQSVGRGEAVTPEAAEESAHLLRHRQLCAAVRKTGREVPVLAGICDRLLAGMLAHPPADFAQSARFEDAVLLSFLRALPRTERNVILGQARALAEGTVLLSARARRMSRRFHRFAVLRKQLELPAF